MSESGAQKRDECWSERYEGLHGPPSHGRGCAGKSQAGTSVKRIQRGAREVRRVGSFWVGKSGGLLSDDKGILPVGFLPFPDSLLTAFTL